MEIPRVQILMTSFDPESEGVGIMAGFNHDGKTLRAAPGIVEFYIIVTANHGARVSGDLRLKAIVEGVPEDIGAMRIVQTRPRGGRGRMMERHSLYVPIELADFERLITNRKLRLEVAEVRFELTEDQLNALRDLASRGRPGS